METPPSDKPATSQERPSRDEIFEQLMAGSRLILDPMINDRMRGKAYAQLGLLFDHRMGYRELAQFCYAHAVRLLDANDALLADILIARAAILGDGGHLSQAECDLNRALSLSQSQCNPKSTRLARKLLDKIDRRQNQRDPHD